MLLFGPLLGLAALPTAAKQRAVGTNETQIVVPNAYIVQIRNDSAVSPSSTIGRGLDHHAIFHKRAFVEIDYDIRTEFKDSDLFYGLTITVKDNLTSAEVEEKLTDLEDVVSVWPVLVMKAPTLYGVVGNSRFPKVAGKDFEPSSALKMFEVDRVHALGIKGSGVKIAIIDSGIDYTHPSLGSGFGPGIKVIGGYHFIGDWYAGISGMPPVEDDDPRVSCQDGGHGTHVVGNVPRYFGTFIKPIQKVSSEYKTQRVLALALLVSPQTEILAYRVFSCYGLSTTETILRALQRAGAEGADVIKMSLGRATSFQSNDPFSVTISGLRARGVATIVSNGNNGQGGVYYTDGPECFTGTWFYFNYKYVGMLYNNPEAFADQYYLDPGYDLDNSLFINLDTADSTVIRFMYEKAGGFGSYKWTLGQLEATSSKQVLTGGMTSNLSSFGPPIDTMVLKPQLSAPGGNILSLWPVGNFSGYAIISGTSMSAPFVTGCYALIKSKVSNLSVTKIQNLMQTTSVPVSWVPDTSILSTAVHQGSGLVNVYRDTTYESSISPGELSIGDTDEYVNKPRNFTITNNSSRSKTYIFSHQGAGYGRVSFSQNSVLLAPGQSTTIQVFFTPPSGVNASKNPITSGFIKVTNNNDQFVIPYAGLPYSRFCTEYFDTSENAGWPYPMSTVDFYAGNITVSGDLHIYTWELRMDIVPANTTFVPDYYGFDPKFEFEYQPSGDPISSKFIGIPTYGNADRRFMMEPQAGWYGWFSKMVTRDGEQSRVQLKKGDYRVLVLLRRRNGDVTKRETWSTYLSPVVRYIDV
ncbi:hypothetical protein IFR05_002185 [Cadophora sp. M221]|nr:hypothetical protein IFR05_002185 [Cadophora sp. M221]